MPSDPQRPSGRALPRLAACLALVGSVAVVGGAVTAPAIPGWYAGLVKPAWTPPNGVFPVAWTLLYILMALTLWRLWNAPPTPARRTAIGLFLLQLALNAMWSPVFFGLHAPVAGFAVILALLVALILALRAAFAVDRPAGALLLPYLFWVCYASSLNGAIVALN
ncbi:TspO/MBR family protein [Xanthobacter agilis]|uniref:Tryptophan-rich sensory protein n=1 Tax=Xanthobacter agilis TaxID=47492 RepID=A0ABU0L9A7_XANAG|nr:TspO/MBR family protein [Xanthobacter agilis]MDQ0503720.1 tryptophan-rich sensory protein [Xanthobacter agilis]